MLDRGLQNIKGLIDACTCHPKGTVEKKHQLSMMPPSVLVGIPDDADEDAEQILSLFDPELQTPVLNSLKDDSDSDLDIDLEVDHSNTRMDPCRIEEEIETDDSEVESCKYMKHKRINASDVWTVTQRPLPVLVVNRLGYT